MRLDFNVLWVDDQPTFVQAQISAIDRKMQAEGFQFVARKCQSVAEVQAALGSDVFTDEVDLILVDWDLGNGILGQNAIEEIRATLQYKDVVFYSGQTAPDILRRLAFDKGLEGIYCASREFLVDEVMGVFDSLVKKVLDLDHTRGIVMGATSDIDYIVNECLIAIHDAHNDEGKKGMLEDALKYIRRRMDELTKTAKGLEDVTDIMALFEAHMILTANDRLRMLGGELKSGVFAVHKDYRPKVLEYQQKVVPDRNILGHQVLIPEGRSISVKDNKGNSITVDETRALRKQILELRTDFRNLLTALQTHGAPPSLGPNIGGAK